MHLAVTGTAFGADYGKNMGRNCPKQHSFIIMQYLGSHVAFCIAAQMAVGPGRSGRWSQVPGHGYTHNDLSVT